MVSEQSLLKRIGPRCVSTPLYGCQLYIQGDAIMTLPSAWGAYTCSLAAGRL